MRNYLLRRDAGLGREFENLKKYGADDVDPEYGANAPECNGDTGSKKSRKKKSRRKNNPDWTGQSGQGRGGGKRSLKVKLEDHVNLIWKNWFSSVPIGSARGRDFSFELAIYDEFQDQNAAQADTLIKRIGRDGKIILTGDVEQIHAPYLDRSNNGLVYASRLLFDNKMVAQVHFTEDEVVRHPLVREVAKRQKAAIQQKDD